MTPTPPLTYSQAQQVRVFVALAYAGEGGLSRAELRGVVGSADESASVSTVTRVCDEMVVCGYVRRVTRGDLPRKPVFYVAPEVAWQVRAGGWLRSYADWCERWMKGF